MNTGTKPRHAYMVDLSTPLHTVKISPSTSYGYFETTDRHPGYYEGGLWFEGKTLSDYDGVYALPTDVCKALHRAHYIVEPEFWPSGKVEV